MIEDALGEAELELTLPDEAASEILGADIALVLRIGDAVALSGELGAGKTTLARAILRQLARDLALEVPSPTYTLVQSYETRPKATHFDLYRIASEEELAELGFEEAAETGIVLVEWASRAPAVLDDCNLRIHLDLAPGGGRRATIARHPDMVLRLDRSLTIRRFLNAAGLPMARRDPFPADASARRYERIVPAGDGPDLVLMDAPRIVAPTLIDGGRSYAEIAHIAQEVLPFVALGETLHAAGYGVPQILDHDLDAGLVLLEHLGSEGILDADGKPIPERYEAAALVLADLHARPFDPELRTSSGAGYRVPRFDPGAMAAEVALLLDWYLPSISGRAPGAAERQAFFDAWDRLFDILGEAETNLLLRDFHSPNILWRQKEEGLARVGILDFQDAMIGPTAYDLASLAQDARVDMPAEIEERLLSAYLTARQARGAGFDEAGFRRAYAIMAAQRATKILGIFVRLHERDGKPQYRRHIPRLRGYLERTLGHPSLAKLKALYDEWGVLSETEDRRNA